MEGKLHNLEHQKLWQVLQCFRILLDDRLQSLIVFCGASVFLSVMNGAVSALLRLNK